LIRSIASSAITNLSRTPKLRDPAIADTLLPS
jgi:hypothetical protein